jgi:hypothetical protein
MKLNQLITFVVLTFSTQSFADTSTYVYCSLPNASDWEWLLDGNDNYVTIEGLWEVDTDIYGRDFNAFKVQESVFNEKTLICPEGYVTQPGDRNASDWNLFKIIQPDGSSYIIDATYTCQNCSHLIPQPRF